jgi:hypothetical protein
LPTRNHGATGSAARLSLPLTRIDPALRGKDVVESRIRNPLSNQVGEVRSALAPTEVQAALASLSETGDIQR